MYVTVWYCPCTNRRCVSIGAHLKLKLLFVFNATWARYVCHPTSCDVHYNIDGGCAYYIAYCWIYDTVACHVGPGRTESALMFVCVCIICLKVLCVYDAIWGCNVILFLCCPNTLQCLWRWRLFVYVHSLNLSGTVSRWPWTNRRPCVCIGVLEFELFSSLCLLNVWNGRCRVCLDCTTRRYVCIGVYLNWKLHWKLFTYTEMAMMAVRLCSLITWYGVVSACRGARPESECVVELEVVICVECSVRL